MALLIMNSFAGRADEWETQIQSAFADLEVRDWPEIGNAEDIEFLIIGRPQLDQLPHLPNLKLMLTMLAGVDGLLASPHLPDAPLVKGDSPDGDAELTEYAVTHVLAHHRNLPAYRVQQGRHEWREIPQISAAERGVGLIGYGTMAKPVAKMLASMNFDVAAWARTAKPDAAVEIFHGAAGLAPFLARTDIAVCLLPLTDDTRGILNRQAFALMPEGASIINLGRGGHVAAGDLIEALDSGHLAAATLDVTEPEPLPEDSPLWDHPKITIMPHVARRPPMAQFARQFIDNIRRCRAGEPLIQLVDRSTGY